MVQRIPLKGESCSYLVYIDSWLSIPHELSALPEHDGLDPFSALSIRQTHAERTCVACQ